MLTPRSTTPRGSAGETSASRRPATRLAMACLVLATIGQAGCKSDGCSSCGLGGVGNNIGNGFRSFTTSVSDTAGRVFRHKKAGCSDCGTSSGETYAGGTVEGMPADGMTSGATIGGPTKIYPGSPPAAPAEELPPRILEQAPSSSGSGSKTPSSSSVTPSNLKAPTLPLSSRGGVGGRADSAITSNPLDNLPDVSSPSDLARRDVSKVPAEADAIRSTPPAPTDPATTRATTPTSVALGGEPVAVASAPKRFSTVSPKVSGGSLPTREGLEWLQDRGFKTLVDLREAAEVDTAFVNRAKSLGLRYISLPIVAGQPDPARVARFRELVTRTDGDHLYFFDADGDGAGLAWYVSRLAFDKVDPAIVSGEAEDIGLVKPGTWVFAAKLLDATRASLPASPASASAPKSTGPAIGPKSPVPTPSASLPPMDLPESVRNTIVELTRPVFRVSARSSAGGR